MKTTTSQKILNVVLLIVCSITFMACLPMTLYKHKVQTGARCLDGSPAALYFIEGQLKDKFVIFFQGGGMCDGNSLSQALQSCYNRSLTKLGSSKQYKSTKETEVVALLSSDPEINPLYHRWTRVLIPYCDGTLHQGSAKNPINFKGKDLYFRGTNNTETHFNFLNEKFDLFKASQVVLTGISAGGIATFIWGNHLYHKLQNKEGLLLAPDSGIFLEIQKDQTNFSPQNKFKLSGSYIKNITNVEVKMPLAECVVDHPDQDLCFKTFAIRDYIIAPTFIIESLYDQWALKYMHGFDCISADVFPGNLDKCTPSQKSFAQKYRAQSIKVLKHYAQDAKNGVWGISCIYHGLIDGVQKFQSKNLVVNVDNKQITMQQALQDFVMKLGRRENIDQLSYPENKGCNGQAKIFQL